MMVAQQESSQQSSQAGLQPPHRSRQVPQLDLQRLGQSAALVDISQQRCDTSQLIWKSAQPDCLTPLHGHSEQQPALPQTPQTAGSSQSDATHVDHHDSYRSDNCVSHSMQFPGPERVCRHRPAVGLQHIKADISLLPEQRAEGDCHNVQNLGHEGSADAARVEAAVDAPARLSTGVRYNPALLANDTVHLFELHCCTVNSSCCASLSDCSCCTVFPRVR